MAVPGPRGVHGSSAVLTMGKFSMSHRRKEIREKDGPREQPMPSSVVWVLGLGDFSLHRGRQCGGVSVCEIRLGKDAGTMGDLIVFS